MSYQFDIYNIYNQYNISAIKDNTYNYLTLKILTFINTQKKKFRNKFTIIGDKELTPLLQKQLFSAAWEIGCAAVSKLGGKNGIYVIYSCIPTKINNQGEVEEAVGMLSTSMNHYENRKNFNKDSFNVKLTNKNAVFLSYNSEFVSGLGEALPSAINYGQAWAAKKNVTLLTPARIISSRNNNDNTNNIVEQSIKDFDLVLRTKTTKEAQPYINNMITKNPIEDILPTSVNVIEFLKNDTLGELSAAINDIKSDYDEMIGNRTNINFKAERNITSEFSFSNVHFSLLENDFNGNLINFILDYKKTFNVEIDVIDEIQEMIQDSENLKNTGDDNTEEIINAEHEQGKGGDGGQ